MNSYYKKMNAMQLRDLLDWLEEQLWDMENEAPEDYEGRIALENLINNICELVMDKECCAA